MMRPCPRRAATRSGGAPQYAPALGKSANWQTLVSATPATGPARFPVARNNKALEAEHRRIEELNDWAQRARAAAIARLRRSRTAEEVRSELMATLRRDLIQSLGAIAGIDSGAEGWRGMDRSAFTSSILRKLRRLAEAGEHGMVAEALAFIRRAQEKMPKPAFPDRSPIWRLGDPPAAEAPSGEELIAEAPGGVQIVNNHDLQRIQIRFPAKPPEAVRARLRGEGWRWSPTNGAWQRQNTAAAIASARRIVGAEETRAAA